MISPEVQKPLEAVVLDERLLERVELAVALQALDGGDPFALLHGRKGHAGHDAVAVDMHGAGAALPAVAPSLRARQTELPAQRVEQRRARLDRDGAKLPIDGQLHVNGSCFLVCGSRRIISRCRDCHATHHTECAHNKVAPVHRNHVL